MLKAQILKIAIPLVVLVLTSSAAFAQAEGSITGTVKDTSGAVLPGVTVEASSPALIEKVRTVITDGSGQYRIVSLRPGIYAVTFTLPGFATVKREGIELTGAFIAAVNAELKVGELTETITVSGATPVVDVQSARKQTILAKDVVDALPSARTTNTIVALVPGVTNNQFSQDVGGTTQIVFSSPVIHGSYSADSRIQFDGFSTSNVQQSDMSVYTANMGSAQEVNVNIGAGTAEQQAAGLIVNVIPKEGGNVFSGFFFGAGTNSNFQSSNFTQRLKDEHVLSVNSVKQNYELNPAFGGPLVKDRLWFYGSFRYGRNENYLGGVYANKNAGLANVFTYVPDFSQQASTYTEAKDGNIRITWQVNPKNKVNGYFQRQTLCDCNVAGAGTSATFQRTVTPEAAGSYTYSYPLMTITWSSPLTSRLLLEAGLYRKAQNECYTCNIPAGDPRLNLIPVTDTVTSALGTPGTFIYHGVLPIYNTIYNHLTGQSWQPRASASYVSGAHAFKVGFEGRFNRINFDFNQDNNYDLRYTFNQGVPNSLTEIAAPFHEDQTTTEVGFYAQDRWTVKRLTLNLGVRYDKYNSSYPDHTFGPGLVTPNRNFTVPGGDYFSYNDVTPKIGAAYDVFGTGKTAIKGTVNKYVGSLYPIEGNPINVVNLNATRSWSDRNSNFVPDCDLTLTAANGECGALASNFGQPVAITTTVDPNAVTGWNHRPYVWEFSAGVQQEILPRVSADVTFFRRVNGNFLVTVNRALNPSQFNQYSVTAPVDARLPNGGGYSVGPLYDLNPAFLAGGVPTSPYRTLTDTYGKQIDHWNGFDLTINARPREGLLLQGGADIGRRSTDDCEVVSNAIVTATTSNVGFAAPPVATPYPLYCHVDTPFLTNLKFVGTYTIPRIDVQISGTLQSFPGGPVAAQVPYTSAQVAPSLGRPLSTATLVTVNVLAPGLQYTERVNQLDLRFGKVIKYQRLRATIGVDLYNALNSDTVLAQTDAYFGPWQIPTLITQGRLAKISLQLNY
jgi:hypothetical protein